MRVSLLQTESRYPTNPPFHPASVFPEALFPEVGSEPNSIYAAVRELFNREQLDSANFGTARWNPLSEIIRPGDCVLLKPNLITQSHPRDPDGWRYLLTHGSVIRAVADYAFKATGNTGEVIVADAPQTDSDFSRICHVLGLHELERYYLSKGLRFGLHDLRQFQWRTIDGVVVSRRRLPGDPKGYVTVNLKRNSFFGGQNGNGQYYGADYDTTTVNAHHHHDIHEYVISRSALACDVLINLPKLKTHKKTGVTLSLKNLVGINGDKNYLPHFTRGVPADGGDEFPDSTVSRRAESIAVRGFRKLALSVPIAGPWFYLRAKQVGKKLFGSSEQVIRAGNWWGNDTCWRMCLDLNRILLYANPDGTLRPDRAESRRKYLTIIDGIIGGDGNGPIDVDPVEAGVLFMGADPVAVDAVAAAYMGFDPRKLPIIANATQVGNYRISDADLSNLAVDSNRAEWCGKLNEIDFAGQKRFRPHFGWRGRIEKEGDAPQ